MVEHKIGIIIEIIHNLEDNGVFELEFIKKNIFPAAYEEDIEVMKSCLIKELQKLDKDDLHELSESTKSIDKIELIFKVMSTVSSTQIRFYNQLVKNAGLSQSSIIDSIKEFKKYFEGIAPDPNVSSNKKKVLEDILEPFPGKKKAPKVVFADDNYDPDDIDLEGMFADLGDVDPEDMN